MVTYVTVASGIEGYNPPDYYRTLEVHSDIDRFLSDIRAGAIISETECKNDVFNGMGKCTVNYLDKRQTYNESVILIRDAGYYIIGKIDYMEFVAEGIIEFKYTIDWYTSVILMSDWNANAFPKAKTVLYRRLMDGEFTYSDEGIVPVKIGMAKTSLKADVLISGQTQELEFFTRNNSQASGIHIPAYLYYHSASDNLDFAIIVRNLHTTGVRSPKDIWERYCQEYSVDVDYYKFDPNNVIYYGYCPIDPAILTLGMGSNTFDNAEWFNLIPHSTGTIEGKQRFMGQSTMNVKSNEFTIKTVDAGTCTEYHRLRILSAEGALVYEVPLGVSFDSGVKVCAYLMGTLNNPTVTIAFSNSEDMINNAMSFSIPFIMGEFYSDSYQVYLSEERRYAQEMRHLQAVNELSSGIIGGVNQGAMISAFSRTGARTGQQAIDKGFIGGGMAIAGAIGNYAYKELYANKKLTEIQDTYNRNKPDALLMAGGICRAFIDTASMYVYDYDDDSIDYILAFQSAFGYQTNKIESDVELNHFTGYVQADIMFDRRKWHANNTDYYYNYPAHIEKYIKDMFNYGVYFTKVV